MMKKQFLLFFIVLVGVFQLGNNALRAQGNCPTNVIINGITSTPNSCAGNGTITVNLSSTQDVRVFLYKEGNPDALFDVTDIQTPYTFNTLQPGNYRVEVKCKKDLQISYGTQQVSVGNTYQNISNANVTSTINCSNFTQSATIEVSSVTGGATPYQYSFVKNSNPNYDDNLSQYQSSNTMQVNGFGTYQIRVKDNCGNYFTITREINATLPPVKLQFASDKTACNLTKLTLTRMFNASNNVPITGDFSAQFPGGVKLEIRHDDSNGKLVYNDVYTGAPIQIEPASVNNPIKTPVYHITTTNACGIKSTYTLNQNDGQEGIATSWFTQGCAPNESINIQATPTNGLVLPVQMSIFNSSGVQTQTYTFTSRGTQSFNLPIDAYRLVATDACGVQVESNVKNPKEFSPVLEVRNYLIDVCREDIEPLTITGATQVIVHLKQGYIADSKNAKLIIKSGPSHVGVEGLPYGEGRWFWSNILPGDYIVSIISCGISQDLPLTIKGTGLLQSLSSTGESVCSGGGNIRSQFKYTGAYTSVIELLNDQGQVISQNNTGEFLNLPPGTYKTRLKITINKCQRNTPKYLNKFYYIDGSIVVLNAASEPPHVSGVALTCEDTTSGSTGTAYIHIESVQPYTIKYKKRGASAWEQTINNIMVNDYNINGLTPGETYTIEVSDSCGKSFNSDYKVGIISDVLIGNTSYPCKDQPYTLAGNYFPGATYKWFNPAGVLISQNRIHNIPSFNQTLDGEYTLEIRWGGCIIRTVKIGLYTDFCGTNIGTKNIFGNVFRDITNDNVVNGTGIGKADGTQLYISLVITDESGSHKKGKVVTTVKVKSDGTYEFANIPTGNYWLVLGTNPLGSKGGIQNSSVDNVSTLPQGWKNTGESISSPGDGGVADGFIFVNHGTSVNSENANFGINREYCYKPAVLEGTALETKVGITAFGRAGDLGGANKWPMQRKGAHLALEAKTKGFVLNRVNPTNITNPIEGMIVYDITKDCLSLYDGASWKCLTKPGCPD